MQITIKQISVEKEGNKNGRSWTLKKLLDTNGQSYSYFASNWNKEWAEGQTVDVGVTKDRYGSVQITGLFNAAANAAASSGQTSNALLLEISKKLDKVIDYIGNVQFSNDFPNTLGDVKF